jgi:PAS domain S-box-containing protein
VIAMIDGEGTLVGWTSTAQRLVGYAAGEVVGRPAWLVLLFLQNLPGHDGKDLA